MGTVNIISEGDNSTVICHKSQIGRHGYFKDNSELELEKSFIDELRSLGYKYIKISNEKDLKSNARKQLEKLNSYEFSDSEWENFYKDHLSPKSLYEGTKVIQENSTIDFRDDSGVLHNIKLIDKPNLPKNSCQVIEQFRDKGGKNRYDVTILVNGLPLVQIELKKAGVNLQEAYNQTGRYKKESFGGLYNFIQLFVISNETYTKYYSSTIKDKAFESKNTGEGIKPYKFASCWADQSNEHIDDLAYFTETFFAKRTLLSILTRYCVFTSGDNEDRELLVMRPYQITATERILSKINSALENGGFGKGMPGGYIWHTTGSGKTLTSFKAATLAGQMRDLYKVVFVVDRQDLDYQTITEYNKYKEGSVDYNGNTKTLKNHLLDTDANHKLVVTTIQKLSRLLGDKWKSDLDKIRNKNFVFIFDECHRSQAGKMHAQIASNFKSSILFGFTGTPIFNSSKEVINLEGNIVQGTTEAIFGDCLHSYTIKDAINDKNVLPFSYSFCGDSSKKNADLNSPARRGAVVEYVLKNFRSKTHYPAFNSLFATDSIASARGYYEEFKRQQEGIDPKERLKIALIYSISPNKEDESDGEVSENDREFLRRVVKEDYNSLFGENRDLKSAGDDIQEYYRDVSKKMREKQLDMTIVVNMFLTGFDAKRLNTFWVDKDLKSYNLIQAFSRTNRIFNEKKRNGVIVSFRDMEDKMNEAFKLYGDNSNAVRDIVILRSYKEQMQGYIDKDGKWQEGYLARLEDFRKKYAPGKTPIGESTKKQFICDWNEILKERNVLSEEEEFKKDDPLAVGECQSYMSTYLEIRDEFEKISQDGKTPEGVVFEIELLSQREVNVDYILSLIGKEKIPQEELENFLMSNLEFRNKAHLITEFASHWKQGAQAPFDSENIRRIFYDYCKQKQEKRLDEIIGENNLKEDKTKKLMKKALEEGGLSRTGKEFDAIFPAKNIFDPDTAEEKDRVYEELKNYMDEFMIPA